MQPFIDMRGDADARMTALSLANVEVSVTVGDLSV